MAAAGIAPAAWRVQTVEVVVVQLLLGAFNKWAAPKRLGPLGDSEKRGVFLARFVMYFECSHADVPTAFVWGF
jgi:hypothetical protein